MRPRQPPPLEYLLDCSKASLHNVLLNHRNKAALARKDVQDLLSDWVEAEAMALLTEWFDLYGEQLISMAVKRDSDAMTEKPIDLPFELKEPLIYSRRKFARR